jgi:hypothetical protein
VAVIAVGAALFASALQGISETNTRLAAAPGQTTPPYRRRADEPAVPTARRYGVGRIRSAHLVRSAHTRPRTMTRSPTCRYGTPARRKPVIRVSA